MATTTRKPAAPAERHSKSMHLDNDTPSGRLAHEDPDAPGDRHTKSFALDGSTPSLKLAHEDRGHKGS